MLQMPCPLSATESEAWKMCILLFWVPFVEHFKVLILKKIKTGALKFRAHPPPRYELSSVSSRETWVCTVWINEFQFSIVSNGFTANEFHD